MTTKVKVDACDNVFLDNRVVNLGQITLPKYAALAGVSWLAKCSSAGEELFAVLRSVYTGTVRSFPGYTFWVFIGNSVWQPDTRIVRHRGLWRLLKMQGVEILHAMNLKEVTVEGESGVKFFGAAQMSEQSIGSTVSALLYERCAYLIAVPQALEIQDLLTIGWCGDFGSDIGFIGRVAKENGIVFKLVGEFDDLERGFIALGNREVLKLAGAV